LSPSLREHCLTFCETLHAHHAGEDPAGTKTELDRLAAELEAHLDYEEEHLVPLLNEMIDIPEDL
jgi:iron-sulfur cluster repair protein YtfE (RIC family)